MANYQNTSGYASNTGSAYGTKAQYSSSSSDGRPPGCCGKGCCWWGKMMRGLI